jgi:MFS family permease
VRCSWFVYILNIVPLANLQITNSATDHAVLGRLNGLAQTLSAAGRAIGPFVSGGLFSAASRVKHKGEALPFGIFAGIAVVGFCLSWGIRDECLEADDDYREQDQQDESAPLLGD